MTGKNRMGMKMEKWLEPFEVVLNLEPEDDFEILSLKKKLKIIKPERGEQYGEHKIFYADKQYYLVNKKGEIIATSESKKKLVPKGVAETL